MEESTQPLCTNGEEEHENDFYEKIEAPKYVDLTAPDRFQPGEDRYWFCSRAGCDQKHEEELDPETVYKNFVLRVMAARSPNIRLRKALYRKDSSAEKKCPQTVPPKPSKPRISRLALMSSMSKRVVDPKLKLKPPSKQKATPTVKAKPSSVAVKALTTPRDRKRMSNHEGFQSVRNQKAAAVAVPKSRVVAKALFLSPKKSVRVKTSSELNTPVKTLCAEMKKLEISDGRKPASGCNKRLPSDASRKQPRAREVKSRVYDGLLPPNGKGQNARSDKCLKKKKKNKEKDMQNNSDLVPPEVVKNDARGTGIEESSRKGSLQVCFASTCDERNVHEGLHISNAELGESKVETSPNHSRSDLHSHKRNPAGSDHAKSSQTPGRESDETNEKIKEEIKSSSEDTNELLESDGKENDCEAMESDDKENASAFDDNRKLNLDTDHPQRKILGKQHTTPKGTLKMSTALGKQSKDNCTSGTQGLKQVKPKATNPKPFRLRTDERRILKEANLEKKLHLTPLKEVTSVPGLPRESLRKRHQITSQRKEKFLEQTKYEGKEKKGINRMKRDQPPIDSSTLKIGKERVGRKFSTVPQRHTVSSQQKLVTPRQENNLDSGAKRSQKRTKSPHVRQLSRQQEAAPVTADMASVVIPAQLSVIKESPPAISRLIEPAETSEVNAVPQ